MVAALPSDLPASIFISTHMPPQGASILCDILLSTAHLPVPSRSTGNPSSATAPVGQRGAFGSMLISLAEHAHERAVAVLLSGMGSDGAAGIVATKKFGGLSIAEAGGHGDLSAQGSSDPAAVADLHLPADRIAGEISRYIGSLQPILQEEEREEDSGNLEGHVTQIATILHNVTGHDFHGYKRGTFIRRIQRRMQVMQVEGGIEVYIERLRADREEVQHLFQDLLIGVTQFFRDPAEFDTLERELPCLFKDKGPDDPFRVWVLGCATGEEAYSIAILLREHMATLDHPPEVQIFATDLDARALSVARAARKDRAGSGPGLDQRWFDTYGQSAKTGKPARFEEEATAMSRCYDVYAFRIGAPEEKRVGFCFATLANAGDAATPAANWRTWRITSRGG